jgi:hypothetical protein
MAGCRPGSTLWMNNVCDLVLEIGLREKVVLMLVCFF